MLGLLGFSNLLLKPHLVYFESTHFLYKNLLILLPLSLSLCCFYLLSLVYRNSYRGEAQDNTTNYACLGTGIAWIGLYSWMSFGMYDRSPNAYFAPEATPANRTLIKRLRLGVPGPGDVLAEVDWVNPDTRGFPVLVRDKGKMYCLDSKGRAIGDAYFEMLYGCSENGLTVAKRNGKFGVVNPYGTEVIPFVYEQITPGAVSPKYPLGWRHQRWIARRGNNLFAIEHVDSPRTVLRYFELTRTHFEVRKLSLKAHSIGSDWYAPSDLLPFADANGWGLLDITTAEVVLKPGAERVELSPSKSTLGNYRHLLGDRNALQCKAGTWELIEVSRERTLAKVEDRFSLPCNLEKPPVYYRLNWAGDMTVCGNAPGEAIACAPSRLNVHDVPRGYLAPGQGGMTIKRVPAQVPQRNL
ncbi:MAG: hypothetical protein NW208_11780 [Bryobacter sp.]|nr:hypothetical protein [Bryobacter sp.]